MLDLGISGPELKKKYCRVLNQHPRICLIVKFYKKYKNAKIWNQKYLIWVFLD